MTPRITPTLPDSPIHPFPGSAVPPSSQPPNPPTSRQDPPMTTLMSSLESESRVKDTPGLQPLASSPFLLPQELEAHEPPEARGLARDEVRLLVSYRPRLDSS